VLVAVGVAGVAATVVTAWAVATSPILVNRSGDVIWRSLFVAAYVAVGEYTWWRRPESRLGPIVAGVGFLYGATSLNASGAPVAYTLGMAVWAVYIVCTGYMYLCFPRGRLESQFERRFMLAFALGTGVVWGLILLLSPTLPAGSDFTNCGTNCPPNALQIVSGHIAAGKALIIASDVVFTVAAIGVAMLVFYKARSSWRLRRRAMTPLLIVVLASIVEFVVSLFVPSAFPGTTNTLKVINGLVTVAVPVAIFAGQVRGDLFAAVSLGRVVVGASGKVLTPVAVEQLIGDALGDSTLTLGLWAPERNGYVDTGGAPLELPRDSLACGVTEVTLDDRPAAVLIHDPTLDTDSDVVEGLAASSLLLLENTRLVEELRTSRLRIVETADRERRRLERDLHDGAQQRLMAVQIKLRLAEEQLEDDGVVAQLEAIGAEAAEAVAELRTLAHGIYPPVLRSSGLVKALRSLAMRAPIAISVIDEGIGRCSPPVEAAIYFCSVEAIQNAIKHAGRNAQVCVTVGRDRGGVRFAISDDGSGMDQSVRGAGDGLIGMRDRVGAVGGELEVISSPGRGTTVRGTVPEAVGQRASEQPEESG
jgi:signal transduction histidine kinase